MPLKRREKEQLLWWTCWLFSDSFFGYLACIYTLWIWYFKDNYFLVFSMFLIFFLIVLRIIRSMIFRYTLSSKTLEDSISAGIGSTHISHFVLIVLKPTWKIDFKIQVVWFQLISWKPLHIPYCSILRKQITIIYKQKQIYINILEFLSLVFPICRKKRKVSILDKDISSVRT